MTLFVQNDAGTIANANSSVSVQDFKDYWTARGVDYTSKTDAEIEAILIPAQSYMDTRYQYCGYKLNGREQTTEFPRSELYDYSGGYAEEVTGIPREIKDAQCEYGHIQAEQGTLQPNEAIDGGVKLSKKKVGPIEKTTEYFSEGQSGGILSYPQADNKIPEYFKCSGYGSMAVHV